MDVATAFALLADFFNEQFLFLLLGTVLLFLIVFVTWWVYRSLSTRDLFSLTSSDPKKKEPGFIDHLSYFTKYFLFFPTLTYMGFLIFSLSLFLLMKPTDPVMQSNILTIAIIMIGTIRMSAYISESMAEDLAKLVPLALLGLVLTTPATALSGMKWVQVMNFLSLMPSALKYLVFIILLELIMRGGSRIVMKIASIGSDNLDESSEPDGLKQKATEEKPGLRKMPSTESASNPR